MRKIPKGKVVSYKQIAEKLGSRACRAVGNAMNKNKSKDVPCHRVVKSNGEIGGFNKGIKKKVKMLKKEGVEIKNQRINLKRYCFRL